MARLKLPQKLLFTALISTGIWLGLEGFVNTFYQPELKAWAAPPPAAQQGAPNLPGSPWLMWEIAPGVRREQGVEVHINSLGLRGPEIVSPKPPGTRRFLTTGDSSIFGFGVADDAVFSSVVATSLGEGVEAVCGAIPGYSSFQSLNLLSMRLWDTEPDLLIIGNLWSDNNFDGFVDKEMLAIYAGQEDSILGLAGRMLEQSAIYRVADWKLRVRDRAQKVRKVGWMLGTGEQVGLRRVEINDYAQNLESMASEARRRGVEVMFLMLSNEEDFAPASTDPGATAKAWAPYRDVMRATAARHGAQLIDVPSIFQASGFTSDEIFLDQMHPTALGHKLIAEGISSALQAANWAEGGPMMGDGDGSQLGPLQDPFIRQGSSTSGKSSVSGKPGRGSSMQAGAAAARTTMRGTVHTAKPLEGPVQIDAIEPGVSAPQVVGSATAAADGSFELHLASSDPVSLRAFVDKDGDGPSASDTHVAFSGDPVDPQAGGHIYLDLDSASMRIGDAP